MPTLSQKLINDVLAENKVEPGKRIRIALSVPKFDAAMAVSHQKSFDSAIRWLGKNGYFGVTYVTESAVSDHTIFVLEVAYATL